MNGETSSPAAENHNPFLSVLPLAIAVLGRALFQATKLVIEQNNLEAAIEQQTLQMEQSARVRTALESLTTRTAQLTQSGNANATLIVEELRRRGITVKSGK